MTKWLVTGAAGLLGRDLTGILSARGERVTGLARGDLDVTSPVSVRAAFDEHDPDVVVNCAAWTAVDDAETREDDALAVNGTGPANLAAACARTGAMLVQVSTDYVFDGTARTPYPEDAEPAPRTAYGRTKLAGEQAVRAALPRNSYIVRTAGLYGAHGNSFVRTMIKLARAGTSPAVVDDQHGQPTWAIDVAHQIHALVSSGAPPGIYHATSAGHTTWFELAAEVFMLVSRTGLEEFSSERAVVPTPTTSAAYRRPAPRPSYSVLGHDAWTAAGIPPIEHWRNALHRSFPAVLASLI